jgi:hypothetical protein
MHARKLRIHHIAVVIAAACFAAPGAQAAESTFPASGSESGPSWTPAQSAPPAQPAQPIAPSVNNEKFRQLRVQCETEVPCGKASGDICVEAAALVLADSQQGIDVPDAFREMKEDQRVKIALRLLEHGVNSSNLAQARAYDWYNRFGILSLNPYADAYRANELMEMMISSGYPGGSLRRIRSQTSLLSITSSEVEKREGCATAKKLLSDGKLDADSMKIARDIVGSSVCTGFESAPK